MTVADPLHFKRYSGGGERPSVLLVHAGIADGSAWGPVAERLATAGHDVVVPDLRGFGRSPDPARRYGHVEDLTTVLDEAEIETAFVAGWSMGGGVAAALAHELPTRVAALALVNSVPPGFDRSPEVLASWEREELLWEAGDTEAMVENDLLVWVAGRGRQLADVDPRVVATVRATLEDLASRWSESMESLERPISLDAEAVLGLEQPLLCIHSELDYDEVREAAATLVERAGARQVEIGGCAHAGPVERPGEYAAALIEFFA